MKQIITLVFISTLIGCNSSVDTNGSEMDVTTSEKSQEPVLMSSKEEFAESPYLTVDNENNPILCWIGGVDENACMYYSISKDDGITFGDSIKVIPTIGLKPHHESMPKVAIKNDGTVVAVYQRKDHRSENRFAGAIYYTQSFDNGKNWTTQKYLHTDTTKGIGRSFFDVATLPDGEVGAIWLDGKKRQRDGSTLCFSKTKNKDGFGIDVEIGQKTCQCCRTNLYVDGEKNVNVAYRDIINDSIRDMVHLVSSDSGNTFSEPRRISADNWIINGCPHTGPTMTYNENGLHFYWYTLGGAEGVFHTTLKNQEDDFPKRSLFSPHARHPQSTTLTDGTIALVWDETFKTDVTYVNRIGLSLQKTDGTESVKYLTSDEVDSSYPVIIAIKNGDALISWTQRGEEKSHVYYKKISVP